MAISLGEFERRHGVNRGTVQRKAKSLGINTSEGLGDEAYNQLKQAFKVSEPVAEVVQGEVVNPEAGPIALAGCQNLPPIPVFDVAGFTDVQALSQAQNFQGQQNLETFVAHMTASYVNYRMQQHLAGIDAAFANSAGQMSGQAHGAVTGQAQVASEGKQQVPPGTGFGNSQQ